MGWNGMNAQVTYPLTHSLIHSFIHSFTYEQGGEAFDR